MSNMTAYATAKYVNDRLPNEDGFDDLPPQMFYTYFKKGMIETSIEEGKRVASPQTIDQWLAKYIDRKRARLTKKAKEVEEQLEGSNA